MVWSAGRGRGGETISGVAQFTWSTWAAQYLASRSIVTMLAGSGRPWGTYMEVAVLLWRFIQMRVDPRCDLPVVLLVFFTKGCKRGCNYLWGWEGEGGGVIPDVALPCQHFFPLGSYEGGRGGLFSPLVERERE